MSNYYAYFLYEYERDSGSLKRIIEVDNCDEGHIQQKYSQNSENFPYIYDAHPIYSVEEVSSLSPSIDISQFDFVRYEYMLEANTVNSDGVSPSHDQSS